MPTKNGDRMAASAVELYANPICCPVKFKVPPRYGPIVTYQELQMKYWKNIIRERRKRKLVFMRGNLN
jgi:hypothetical protein